MAQASSRPLPAAKQERYAEVASGIAAVLGGEPNRIARMATVTSMLANAFPGFLWTGFYMVDNTKPDELVVGPYQGTLGCLRIPFGKGVCGAAAATEATQIVPDVHAFPGHIACDSASASELVVPIVHEGRLIGVLDLDSPRAARFDAEDRDFCIRLVQRIAPRLAGVETAPPQG